MLYLNEYEPPDGAFALNKLLALPGEGERLDRFELVAEIAAGGMATVYLARLRGVAGFKRFVAIKRLHPHLAAEPEFIEMFLDEARLAARLHHPNVVPILEIGQSADQFYLVMEYIEGDTAGRLVARAASFGQRVPPPIVARIMLDSLTGLHVAHELRDDDRQLFNLVHRDVSPQNILVGVDGISRLTDFGVARATARLTTTRAGQVKGKLAYLSPEQVRGGAVDRRADIFAAGIVMWELMTSERLFKGEADADTLFRIVAAEVPSMRAIQPLVHPAVEAVCLHALAREPAERFQTAQDFAEALEHAARSTGQLASVRESSEYVNQLIGQDISEQREIVREWLAKSDSRSGVSSHAAGSRGAEPGASVPSAPSSRAALLSPSAPVAVPRPSPMRSVPPGPVAPRPHVPAARLPAYQAPQGPALPSEPAPPQRSRLPSFSADPAPPPPDLTSLEDDDEDIATRVDAPLLEDAPYDPRTAAGGSREHGAVPSPRVVPAAGVRPFNNTMPLFARQPPSPLASPGPPLPAQSPFSAMSPSQPLTFPAAPPARALAPTLMVQERHPASKAKLPLWTLAIPAAVIAVASVILAVRFMSRSGPIVQADAAPSAQPAMSVSSAPPAVAIAPPAVATALPQPAPTPPAVLSAAPPGTTTAAASTTVPHAPTAPKTLPKSTAPATTAPKPVTTPPVVKKTPAGSELFGGRR